MIHFTLEELYTLSSLLKKPVLKVDGAFELYGHKFKCEKMSIDIKQPKNLSLKGNVISVTSNDYRDVLTLDIINKFNDVKSEILCVCGKSISFELINGNLCFNYDVHYYNLFIEDLL